MITEPGAPALALGRAWRITAPIGGTALAGEGLYLRPAVHDRRRNLALAFSLYLLVLDLGIGLFTSSPQRSPAHSCPPART